jgi:hypothetical protein
MSNILLRVITSSSVSDRTTETSSLVDRKEPPPLDAELLEGLSDETTREITRRALRLPEREREILLGIVRQFGETR